MTGYASDEMKELDEWLSKLGNTPEGLAEQAFTIARGGHRGGELPKYMRGRWSDLPKDYREFLVFLVRHALDHA